MPEELRIPSTVNWQAFDGGPVGAGLRALRGGADGASAAMTGAGAAGLTALKAMGNEFMARTARSAGVTADLGAVGNAASAAAGATQNPYLTAVFNGVEFRKFSFRFKFSPTTSGECKTIDDIIKEFRSASLPPNNMTDPILLYPDECQIRYVFDENGSPVDHPYLKKFKRSVITGIDVTYGDGSQWTQFRNGFPTTVTLSMEFMEIDPVYRKDVEGGF